MTQTLFTIESHGLEKIGDSSFFFLSPPPFFFFPYAAAAAAAASAAPWGSEEAAEEEEQELTYKSSLLELVLAKSPCELYSKRTSSCFACMLDDGPSFGQEIL